MEARVEKWQKEVEEELRQQRQVASSFRAQPPRILHQDPFVPQKSDRPFSEISNVELHSDRRARERKAYEMEKKKKEAELEAKRREVMNTEATFRMCAFPSGSTQT